MRASSRARVAVDGGPPRGTSPGEPGGIFRTRGHDRALAGIARMIGGRVPHAILISGPGGIGKTTLALDLAAGLLCDAPDPADRPCRACRACRLVDCGRHPDLHRLAPSGPGDQIRIGRRDAPEEGTVRRLASDLVLLPVEGGARVAILERADRLGDDAQTALLKTLEEPPPGVTIVLCADDEDRLMPTVRSRSARIRLGPVATRDVETILADAGLADPPTAARLARIAGGRPGAARAMARAPSAIAARDEINRTLLDLLGETPAPRLAAVRDLTKRATDLGRALDRAALDDSSTAADGPAPGARRGRGRASPSVAPGPIAAPPTPGSAEGPAPGGDEGDGDPEDEVAGAGRIAVPAAERRRASLLLVGLWRELARDLLVIVLGDERHVRDPGLLDDLRTVAIGFGPRPGDGSVHPHDPAAADLGTFLARLDTAGELLEANVRPEIVLDSLLLHWPRIARR